MTKVSVIIPTFNRAHVLKRAIDSVLSQSFKDLELIVVDDASTDQTEELINQIDDSRLKFLKLQKNVGVSAARNRGFDVSTGEWIALLDSDDEWLLERLERQLEIIKANPKYRLIHGEEIWIRKGKRVNPKKIHQKSGGDLFIQSLDLCLISPSASLIRRDLWLEHQGFDEEFIVCEDYDLWLKVTAHEEVGFSETPIINKYGGHEDQLSNKYKAMDYWRVRSIDRLLKGGGLSNDKAKAGKEVLLKKSQILKQGYLKHQNLEHLDYIESLLREYA